MFWEFYDLRARSEEHSHNSLRLTLQLALLRKQGIILFYFIIFARRQGFFGEEETVLLTNEQHLDD